MSRWKDLDYVLKQLGSRMQDEGLSPQERLWFNNLYNRLLNLEVDIDEAIWQAKQIGVRNPAFPDDLVGWLDDDFDDEDDDEEDRD